jgi:hypothetical protein
MTDSREPAACRFAQQNIYNNQHRLIEELVIIDVVDHGGRIF